MDNVKIEFNQIIEYGEISSSKEPTTLYMVTNLVDREGSQISNNTSVLLPSLHAPSARKNKNMFKC